MAIYIIFWISILLMVFLELKTTALICGKIRIESRIISFISVFAFAILLGVFRNGSLGVDVQNYQLHFFAVRNLNWLDTISYGGTDAGFYLVTKVISLFTDDYDIYKSILFIITTTTVSCIILKESRYPAVSFMVYFSLGFIGFNFCILRQALAMSICFFGFRFAKDKKLIKFIFWVFIAALFHSTAIVFIFVYPIINSKISGISMIKKVLLMVVAYIFGRVGLKYVFHFFHTDYSSVAISNQGMTKLLIYVLIIIGIRMLLSESINNRQKEYETAFVSIYMQLIALSFSLFTRITQYFIFYLALVVPEVFEKRKNNLIYLSFIIVFTILYFVNLNGTNIIPYVTIFSDI